MVYHNDKSRCVFLEMSLFVSFFVLNAQMIHDFMAVIEKNGLGFLYTQLISTLTHESEA